VGQRGPKPKPAALKLLAGNPGKRSTQSSGGRGRVRKGVPDRPPELTGEAAAEWDRVAPELDAAGLLAVTDRGILAALCLTYQDMLACRDTIAREGRYLTVPIQTSKGEVTGEKTVTHPAVKDLAEACKRYATIAKELGVTAASRARLEGDGGDGDKGNRVSNLRERIQQIRTGG
jgi:P27 family predicted phage terminase small subunit